jgi:ribosomal protein S17
MTETTETRNQRKQLEGIVISDKMDKTIVVQVKDLVQHPLYRRIIKRMMKLISAESAIKFASWKHANLAKIKIGA